MSGHGWPASDAQWTWQDGLPVDGESQGGLLPLCHGTRAFGPHFPLVTETKTFGVQERHAGPVPVILNAGGGTASRLGTNLAHSVEQAFTKAGLKSSIRCVDGRQLSQAVAEAEGPIVVVGGGDGTLGTAAATLAGTGRALGILPLGTRNHLALQLGIPTALEEAAALIAGGNRTEIDLGCAHDRVFVNNFSVGLYPRLVQARERARGPLPKWLATIPAAASALRHLRVERFRMEWNGAEHQVTTPLLFVGNNRYLLEAGRLGERTSLSDGRLSVAAVAAPTRVGLLGTMLRLILGRIDADTDFAALEDVEELCIYGHHLRHVALDGELVQMRFPLRLKSWPGALCVIVPATQERQSAPAV